MRRRMIRVGAIVYGLWLAQNTAISVKARQSRQNHMYLTFSSQNQVDVRLANRRVPGVCLYLFLVCNWCWHKSDQVYLILVKTLTYILSFITNTSTINNPCELNNDIIDRVMNKSLPKNRMCFNMCNENEYTERYLYLVRSTRYPLFLHPIWMETSTRYPLFHPIWMETQALLSQNYTPGGQFSSR